MEKSETGHTGNDSLRVALEAAFAGKAEPEIKEEVQEAAPQDAPIETQAIEETAEEKEARERDDKGRFKTKEAKEEKEQAKAAPKEAEPVDKEPQKAQTPPPQGWNGKGKIEWSRLPQAVKEAIAEDHKAATEAKTRLGALDEVLNPRKAMMTAQYGSEANAIKAMFALSDFAARDKMGFINWFAQQHGINLGQQAPANAQGDEYVDPHLQAARQEIAELKQQFTTYKQQQEHQSQTATINTAQQQIDSFANEMGQDGNPKHPYFNDVRQHMVGLMRSGQVQSLQEAYDAAVWANPTTRASMLEQQKQQFQQQQQKTVESAKRAAISVSGAPGLGGGANDAPKATVRDELLEQFKTAGVRI